MVATMCLRRHYPYLELDDVDESSKLLYYVLLQREQ